MALWQFDFYIVPKKMVRENTILDEDILSWKLFNGSLINVDFMEKHKSWTEDIVQYGKENETCIKFLYEEDMVEEISCRLDLRSLSKNLLKQIMDYIKRIEGVIFYDNQIFSPNVEEIVKIMKCSKANKFCQNPTVYFDEM